MKYEIILQRDVNGIGDIKESWGNGLQAGRSRVRSPILSLEFSIDIILLTALLPLGSTQPLTEMSTRNISWWGKGGRCVGLTNLPSSCADCLEIWEPQTSWKPHGLSRTVMGSLYLLPINKNNCLLYRP
jgi:hypothetical protein